MLKVACYSQGKSCFAQVALFAFAVALLFGVLSAICVVPAYGAEDALAYVYIDKDGNGENTALVVRDTPRSESEINQLQCVYAGRIVNERMPPWHYYSDVILSMRFETADPNGVIRPSTMNGWFNDLEHLESFDATHLDTSRVTEMQHLFQLCFELEELDLSGFDTSNVNELQCAFRNCRSLRSLDLSSFDTAGVHNVSELFAGCTSLSRLVIGPRFELSNAQAVCFPDGEWKLEGDDSHVYRDFGSMIERAQRADKPCVFIRQFDGLEVNEGKWGNCVWKLDSDGVLTVSAPSGSRGNLGTGGMPLGLEKRKQIKSIVFKGDICAPSCERMFSDCIALSSVDLSRLDTSSATSMYSMFNNCPALRSLDVSKFDTSNVTDMGSMFAACTSLESLDLTSFNTSRVTDMRRMFQDCRYLASVDLSSFDTSSVKKFDYQFDGCTSLGSVDLSSYETSNAVSMRSFLCGPNTEKVRVGKGFVVAGDCEGFANGMWQSSATGKFYHLDEIPAGVADTYKRIARFGDVTYVTISDKGEFRVHEGNPSEAHEAEVYYLYYLSQFNSAEEVPWHDRREDITSVVVEDSSTMFNFAYWFTDCKNLRVADLRNMDFSSTHSLRSLFEGCSSLEHVMFPENQNTRISVLYLDRMFYNCTSLESLDLSFFSTRHMRSMRQMLFGCPSLRSITLGNDFTFRGRGTHRLPGGEFPNGAWKSSVEKGVAYLSNSIPNFTAATYTKLTDKEVEESTNISIVSIKGESDEGKPQLTVASTIDKNGVEHLSYDVADDYAGDTLYVGDSPRASAAKIVNATVSRMKVLDKVRANSGTTKVVLQPSVARVEAYAFWGTGVTTLTVKSSRLTTRASVLNCLAGSSVSKVSVQVASEYSKNLVKRAFSTWSGKRAKVK